MKILVKDVPGLVIPSQANPKDGAYDVVATTPPNIVGHFIERPIDSMKVWGRVVYIEYGTNLFIAPVTDKTKTVKGAGSDLGNLTHLIWKEIETEYHTELFSRSSISKYNLLLANGVPTIDNPYRGQIMLRFKYLFQPEDYVVIQEAGGMRVYGMVNNDTIYQIGDKICQLKARPNIPIEFERVQELDQTQRGEGGFGSSGK